MNFTPDAIPANCEKIRPRYAFMDLGYGMRSFKGIVDLPIEIHAKEARYNGVAIRSGAALIIRITAAHGKSEIDRAVFQDDHTATVSVVTADWGTETKAVIRDGVCTLEVEPAVELATLP